MLNPINVLPEQFLSCFFEPGDAVCIRVFDDRKSGAFKGLKLQTEAGKFSALDDTLRKHNAENRGIFFVVNYGGHNDGEITTSIRQASDAVLTGYERPADQSEAARVKRASYGQEFYDRFAGNGAAHVPAPTVFQPYKVRVTATTLYYRSGAGTDFPVMGTVRKGEIFTIVEETDGVGASKWGRLKSGAGWLPLDYVGKL